MAVHFLQHFMQAQNFNYSATPDPTRRGWQGFSFSLGGVLMPNYASGQS